MSTRPINPPRGFQGVWIPASLWLSKDLIWTEKLLIVEIGSLCGKDGPCWANTEYLSGMLGIGVGRVNNMLSDLTKRGYLLQLGSNGRNVWRCPGFHLVPEDEITQHWEGRFQEKLIEERQKQTSLKSELRLHSDTETSLKSEVRLHSTVNGYIEREIEERRGNAESVPPLVLSSKEPPRKKKKTDKLAPPSSVEEFIAHGETRSISEQDCRDLFEIWEDGNWHDGAGNPILNWKLKLTTFKKNGWLPSDKRNGNGHRNGSKVTETENCL